MKRFIDYFLAFASIVLIGLQACSLEETAICPENPEPGEETPIKFTTTAPVATRTSVDGNSWVAGDSVGIYMLDDAPPYTTNGVATSLNSNRKYTIANSAALSNLTPDGSQNLFYKGSPLRFISYYPFVRNVINYTIPVDVRKQDKPEEIDVLYSSNATGVTMTNPVPGTPVKLTYQHILSKLIIDVRVGVNTDVNIKNGVQVVIENQPLTGNFQLDSIWSGIGTLNGALGLKSLGAPVPASGYDSSYQVLLIPHAIDNGKELIQIQTQRRLYSWEMPPEMTDFLPGTVYRFSLTLNGESNVEFKSEINPWTDHPFTGNENEGIGSQDPSGAPYARIIGGGLDTLGVRYMKVAGDPFQVGTNLPIPSGATANYMSTKPVHKAELSANYHITEAAITCAQYCTFLNDPNNHIVGTVTAAGSNVDVSYWIPGATAVKLYTQPSGTGVTNNTIVLSGGKWVPATNPQYPMTSVGWHGAQAYARWAGGNLPTEAQWEYAARDGVPDDKDYINPSLYDGASAGMAVYANIQTGANPAPLLAVKSRTASPNYKMYDMFGNVWEWCYDRFAAAGGYPGNEGDTVQDPNDPSNGVPTGVNGVIRGGCLNQTAVMHYIGGRYSFAAASMNNSVGFRVVFALQ